MPAHTSASRLLSVVRTVGEVDDGVNHAVVRRQHLRERAGKAVMVIGAPSVLCSAPCPEAAFDVGTVRAS
jgi:hypothetical protein